MLGFYEKPQRGVMNIGVFYDSAVEDVLLPSTLKVIEYGAFEYCWNLRKLVLPSGL